MQTYVFDDRNVTWQTIEVIDAQIHVLAIDDDRGIVESWTCSSDFSQTYRENCTNTFVNSARSFYRENCSSNVRMDL
jgi:hypothetical protein